jgi:hypothetical protein
MNSQAFRCCGLTELANKKPCATHGAFLFLTTENAEKKTKSLELSAKDVYTLDMAVKRKHKNVPGSNPGQINEVRAAIDYGIDVSMLIENLKRTPAERIKRHQIALETAEQLRKARHL